MVRYKKIILAVLLLSIFITTGFSRVLQNPKTVYRVYLKGESIGLIESKVELENYIDKKQAEIKEKYGVEKVYAPTDLDIVKEYTYYDKVSTTKEIYNKMKDISPFTINGYVVTINGLTKTDNNGNKVKEKNQKIYVIDKKVFTDAIEATAKAFIPESEYEAFANDTQKEIETTGKIIEKIYIENKITIKQDHIPVNKTIYMDKTILGQYLLFGTTSPQKTYIVQEGDTIEDISFNNKISTEEFLIANPDITSTKTLLYKGQEVTIGILKPQVNVVEWDYVVKDEEQKFTSRTEEDPSQYTNYSEVRQVGVNGMNRVTQKLELINGENTSVVGISTEVLKSPVEEIIVKGTKPIAYGGSGYGNLIVTKGIFGWPATCSTISSPFGYRWGSLHDGTDIAGCGYGSNIFAAESGTVVQSSVKWDNGEYVTIQHDNGYFTMYAHMCSGCRKVQVGDRVTRGQVIGLMGQTGWATGIHVHFSVWTGYPYRSGSIAVDPMQFY
ncbi:MAG: peptidoglycan DD-metalloendopeptidase family protein [Bacilli bacterium]|nr:peptidoglycan DD-metalloendopeptidase family protein [Bacilli bacterium]